jgi:hypothetical protein
MVENCFPRRFLLLLLPLISRDSAFIPTQETGQERITLWSVSDKQLM